MSQIDVVLDNLTQIYDEIITLHNAHELTKMPDISSQHFMHLPLTLL